MGFIRKFFSKKKDVDFSYSTSGTQSAGTGNVDKSGRIITKRIHTDGFSVRRRLRIPLLDVYVLKELVPSFIVAELFFTFVYLIKGIQEAIEQIVNKGLPASEVLTVVGYMVGKAVPLTTPMAVLMAGIVTAGRFSSESEFVAMRAAGVGYSKIFRPFIAFSLVVAAMTFYFSNVVSPDSYIKFDAFKRFIESYNPIAVISPGEFVSNTTDPNPKFARVMYVQDHNRETGELTHIQIRMIATHKGRRFMRRLVVAPNGKEIYKVGSDKHLHKTMRLFNGFVLDFRPSEGGAEVTDFRKGYMDIYLDGYDEEELDDRRTLPQHYPYFGLVNQIEKETPKKRANALKTLPKKRRAIEQEDKKLTRYKRAYKALQEKNPKWGKKKLRKALKPKFGTYSSTQGRRNLRRMRDTLEELEVRAWEPMWDYKLELATRWTYSVYCIIFGFIGVSLGLVVNRSGRGMGFIAAIGLIVIYVTGFNVAQRMASQAAMSPSIGPWLTVVVMMLLAAYFVYTRTTNRGLWETIVSSYYRLKLRYVSNKKTDGA